jgi:2-polyprenyl-3-methyl-5-hydroxy-6-metoxy-1,4-benzoquinol methylase
MTSKYDTDIDLEHNDLSHALIVELVGSDKRVLDVSTYTEQMAKVLGKRGCKVTRIEVDPETTRQVEEYCETIIIGDVESLDLGNELDEESFDVIVLGDVLEHLKDPLQTLRRLKPFLRAVGYVVASVRNIAHGSVRLALIEGEFHHPSLGLVDELHLRFFTRESVEQLCKDAGFLITELKSTTRAIFDTEKDGKQVPDEVLRLVQGDPEASTYQYVLTAHRCGEVGTLAKRVWLLSEQLAERDRTIYELNRRLRNFEELQNILDRRTKRLAEKEREVAMLAQEVAERNDRIARLMQFGGEGT